MNLDMWILVSKKVLQFHDFLLGCIPLVCKTCCMERLFTTADHQTTNTKHETGTLPLNMYRKELPVGERIPTESVRSP